MLKLRSEFIVQDQGCLSGLVLFLDNEDKEVMQKALEVKTWTIIDIYRETYSSKILGRDIIKVIKLHK